MTARLQLKLPTQWGAAIGAVIAAVVLAVLGALHISGIALPGPQPLEGRGSVSSASVRRTLLGADLLWYALLTMVGVGLALSLRRRFAPMLANPQRMLLLIGGLMALTWATLIALGQSYIIDGRRHWWLFDDAMISMRYARNLATGNGLVWNPGEYVEGYTNFLWTVFMAAAHLLPLDAQHMPLPILAANLLIGLGTLPIIAALVRELGGSHLAAIGTAALFAFNLDLVFWSTSGLETGLLTFLTTLLVVRIIQDARSAQPRLLTALIGGIIPLVRSDAIIIAALLFAYALWLQPARHRLIVHAGLAALLPLAHLGFRLAYYQAWLPNTAVLKVLYWDNRYQSGVEYVGTLLRLYALPFLAAIAALRTAQREVYGLLAVIAGFLLYIGYVGGDAFPYFRFFIPMLPLVFALAVLGLQNLPLPRIAHGAIVILVLATFRLIGPSYLVELSYATANVANIEVGRFLSETMPTARVAAFAIGSTFYISGNYGVDLLGKIDPYIAQLQPVPGKTVPGHNKFDFDYSLRELRSDLVITEFAHDVAPATMEALAANRWGFNGDLYLNPAFQQACLPNPIFTKDWPTTFGAPISRTIYRCNWSAGAVPAE
jgi:hypothetical protein